MMAVNFVAGDWLLTVAGTLYSDWNDRQVPKRLDGDKSRLEKAKAAKEH
jgi:hypothetical protein